MALVCKNFSDIITFTRASTATYFDSAGVLTTAAIDAPRFDFNPSTLAAQGLLSEESRANLLLRSAEFDNATWNKSNARVTANAATAPDGGANADKLIENAGTGTKQIFQPGISFVSGTAYTYTVFVKQAERSFVYIVGASGVFSAAPAGSVNLSSGAIVQTPSGNSSALTVRNVGNGWFRIEFTATATSTTNAAGFDIRPSLNGTDLGSYTGDGTSGIFIWGAQLEAGAFPTSYIPTTTTALTRSADVASVNTLSPWYNASAGTVYAGLQRYALIPSTALANAWALSDNTNNERFLAYNTGSVQTMDLAVTDGGVAQATLVAPNAITANATIKTAFAYAVNDFAFVRDAGVVQTDTSGTLPTVDRLYIGANATGIGQWTSHIRRITYYPRRLSNAELQAITA
jgi:hypothetical protein